MPLLSYLEISIDKIMIAYQRTMVAFTKVV